MFTFDICVFATIVCIYFLNFGSFCSFSVIIVTGLIIWVWAFVYAAIFDTYWLLFLLNLTPVLISSLLVIFLYSWAAGIIIYIFDLFFGWIGIIQRVLVMNHFIICYWLLLSFKIFSILILPQFFLRILF